MSKLVDLRKSFAEFSGNNSKSNKWRSQIKSYISSKEINGYLTKECLAEYIGKEPFSHSHRNEFLPIILNDQIYVFRSQSLKQNKISLMELNNDLQFNLQLYKSKIYKIKFKTILKSLKSKSFKDIYIEIKFNFEGNNHTLINKVDYLNFSHNKRYIQPIMGYVPMFIGNKLSYGYCVINIKDGVEQKLQFLLKEDIKLFTINKNDNFIKRKIKIFFNTIMFKFRRSEFSSLHTFENSKVTFFKYIN